jgi:hypothetical protein
MKIMLARSTGFGTMSSISKRTYARNIPRQVFSRLKRWKSGELLSSKPHEISEWPALIGQPPPFSDAACNHKSELHEVFITFASNTYYCVRNTSRQISRYFEALIK